jgi:mevalonate kinase
LITQIINIIITDKLVGVPKNTSYQVSKYASLLTSHPTIMTPITAAISAIPLAFIDLLITTTGFYKGLATLIRFNQGLLKCAGMSCLEIDALDGLVEKEGYDMKLTGAGGIFLRLSLHTFLFECINRLISRRWMLLGEC